MVTGEEEFTLAETDAYRKLEIEVLGTSTIREIQLAEDVRELGDGGTPRIPGDRQCSRAGSP